MSNSISSKVKEHFFKNPKKWRHSHQIIFILIFGIIGVSAALLTHAASATGPIVGIDNKCLDNYAQQKVNYNKIDLYQCNNTSAQNWTYNPTSGTIVNVNGYCLDVYYDYTSIRTAVDLYQCNGTKAQVWSVNATAGTITSPQSGLCLTDRNGNTRNLNPIWMYTCNGTSSQHWNVTSPAPVSSPPPVVSNNVAPGITSASSTTFTAGTAGSFTIGDTGTPAPTLSESGSLPSGISFSTSTGVLSGTATSSGAYTFTITASNGVSPNAIQTFTLTVNPAPTSTSGGGGSSGGSSGSGGTSSSVFRLFGSTSLWNTTKDPTNFATAANSTIQGISFGLNNGAYDHPLYIAKSTDPLTTFKLGAGWGHSAETLTGNAPAGMVQASGGDADMDVLMTDGTLLDMYGVSGGGTSWTAEYYGTSDGVNGPGFGTQPYTAIGTTAVGSPQAAGTVLASDVAAGVIPHGLTMACDYTYLGGATTGAGDQVAPAVSNDDGGGGGPLPEGGLLFIPSGTKMPSGLSTMGKQLWDAATTYGVYITDQAGGGCYFYGDGSSTVGNAFTSTDLNDVGQALELVDNW